MIEITDEQMARVRELCAEYGVVKLEVFGSAATDAFDPERSDLDLVATFGDRGVSGFAKRFFAFEKAIQVLFDRPVDLLTSATFDNPFMQRSVDRTIRTIYERRPTTEAVA